MESLNLKSSGWESVPEFWHCDAAKAHQPKAIGMMIVAYMSEYCTGECFTSVLQ